MVELIAFSSNGHQLMQWTTFCDNDHPLTVPLNPVIGGIQKIVIKSATGVSITAQNLVMFWVEACLVEQTTTTPQIPRNFLLFYFKN